MNSNFEGRLEKFREDRNWLIHKSYQDYYNHMYDVQRMVEFAKRADGIAKEATDLTSMFWGLTAMMAADWGEQKQAANALNEAQQAIQQAPPP